MGLQDGHAGHTGAARPPACGSGLRAWCWETARTPGDADAEDGSGSAWRKGPLPAHGDAVGKAARGPGPLGQSVRPLNIVSHRAGLPL